MTIFFADASCLDDACVLGCTQGPVHRTTLISFKIRMRVATFDTLFTSPVHLSVLLAALLQIC